MDLMEYQAKELFAKHGVPVTLGKTSRPPPRRRPLPRGSAARSSSRRRSRPVAAARPEASSSRRRPTRPRSTPATSSGWRSRASRSTGSWSSPAEQIAEEYYFSFLLDRSNRSYLCIASRRGRRRDRGGREDQPRRGGEDRRSTPAAAWTRRRPREIVDEAGVPRRAGATRPSRWCRRCGRSSSRRTPPSSRSTRWPGWPATSSRRSTARSRSTRTPTSGTRTTPQFEDKDAADPLEAKAKAKGLNYVKLDGCGRHHRQRRRAGHVHARRRRVRRRGARRGQPRPTSSTSAAAPTPR